MQTVVALSSTEAEYYGLSQSITEVLWIRSLVTELNFKITSSIGPIIVYEDNEAARNIANESTVNRPKRLSLSLLVFSQCLPSVVTSSRFTAYYQVLCLTF